ncbi:MAG: YabP/YqfC family sporulation protein [Bacillota bacterium]|jgi:sporulation protein YqfC
MDSKKNLKKNVAQALELPGEIAGDLLKITLLCNESLVAENHKGIMEYSQNKIILKSAQGIVQINGSNLCLLSLQADELQINGQISSIDIENDE